MVAHAIFLHDTRPNMESRPAGKRPGQAKHPSRLAGEGYNQMKKRLAFIDLDGTLLGPDKRVSRANFEALQLLRDAGFATVPASGRHHLNILPFHERVGNLEWSVSSQGAVVKHAATGEQLYEITIPEVDALALYEAARLAGLALIVYHRDGVFIEAESEWTRHYARNANWTPRRANLSRLAAEGVQKIVLTNAPEILEKMRGDLVRVFGERLYAVVSDDELLEFLSLCANKARGAETLANHLGVAREDTMAFGDGNNDVEILRWAGISVAMDHGRLAARESANHISPPGTRETAFARAVKLALEYV